MPVVCPCELIFASYITWLFPVLTLTFRPDGREFAVATLNAHITFWDTSSAQQKGTVEGRHDLGYPRKDTDKVSGKTSAEGK